MSFDAPPPFEVVAQVLPAEPFTACTAEVRTLPLQDAILYQSDLPSAHDLIVASAKRRATDNGPESVVLLDAASGRRVRELSGVWAGNARQKRAVVAGPGRDEHELLDLRDGRLVRPRIETPDGAAREWWMALDDERVWLIARSPRDTTFVGVWPEPHSPRVSLTQPFPFWPDGVSQGSAVIAHRAERGCLLDPAGTRCFKPERYAHVLGGRFLVGVSRESIYDTLSFSDVPLDESCEWRAAATLVEPPRVLLACLHEDEVRWELWSPDGVRTRFSTGTALFPKELRRDTRVVPLELLVDRDALSTLWFDLVGERLIVTPPLVELFPQDSFGPRIVAENEGDGGLYLLDVEAATLTSLLPNTGCQGTLLLQDSSDQYAIVACPKESMRRYLFNPDERPRHYEWIELFDFRTRRRLRSAQVFEAKLTESGIAVGIRPGAVSTLAALDWPKTCTAPASAAP